MTKTKIEGWALDVLRRVEEHQFTEDSRVELKAEWPDPARAARRLAGHANAARGEPILWLVGVDQKAGKVVGAKEIELANWFPSVQGCFLDVWPELADLAVPYNSVTVCALYFTTERPPYLVRNPEKATQTIEFEVPWRDATRVRTATRQELVSILAPLARVPAVETLEAHVEHIQGGGLVFEMKAELYLIVDHGSRLTFPSHKCCVSVIGATGDLATGTPELRPPMRSSPVGQGVGTAPYGPPAETLYRRDPYSATVRGGPDQVIVEGPGLVIVEAVLRGPKAGLTEMPDPLSLTVSLCALELPAPLVIPIDVHRERENSPVWKLKQRG